MKVNKGEDYTKDKYTENDWIYARSGYCRCIQCGNWHNVDNTSSSNWVTGVCSDECLDNRYPNKDSLAHRRKKEKGE